MRAGQLTTPLLTGQSAEHRDSVYMEFYDIRARARDSVTATSVRTASARLTMYHALSTGELYDLGKDPGEFTNLWDDPNSRPLKEEMMTCLVQRMAGTVDPLPARHAPW